MPRANRATDSPRAVVRRATPDDHPALVGLLDEILAAGHRGSRPFLREAVALSDRLGELVTDDDTTILVAESGTEAVGMAVLTRAPLSSLSEVPTLRMDYAIVARRARRQGVGRALVAAAADTAEQFGMEQLAVTVVPTDRDSNRFYARLGFAPVVVRRAATVAALRRKLAALERRPVVEDLARRRLLRAPSRPGRTIPRVARGR